MEGLQTKLDMKLPPPSRRWEEGREEEERERLSLYKYTEKK